MTRHPGFMAIDWSNMVHRAFHGLGGSEDLFSQEIFNRAVSMSLNAARAILPSGSSVVYIQDGGLSGRDLLFPGYKANRTNREERPHGLITALSASHSTKNEPISFLRVEGYEADDVMANLAWEYALQNPGSPTYILSNDKDLYQIVSDDISIFRHKGSGDGMLNMELITPEGIFERYGFEPLKMVDYKALQGDVADCIPSIPRIGHGIACKLIQTWGSANGAVEAALADLSAPGFTPKIKQTLIENWTTIKLNQQLIRLKKVPNTQDRLARILELQSPIL